MMMRRFRYTHAMATLAPAATPSLLPPPLFLMPFRLLSFMAPMAPLPA